MALSLGVAFDLAKQCAPQVAAPTMVALIINESGRNALAIGDNTTRRSLNPASRDAATALASALIERGHSIDMGIAQINSRTARAIGLSVRDAFDPCASMAAASRLMVSAYRRFAAHAPSEQHALGAMLSTYNTGNSRSGFRNGYVGRVYRAAVRTTAISLAAIPTGSPIKPLHIVRPGEPEPLDDPAKPERAPSWSVFGASLPATPPATMVFSTNPKG